MGRAFCFFKDKRAILVLAMMCAGLVSCAAPGGGRKDSGGPLTDASAVMGDWQGNGVLVDGTVLPLAGQAIALGDGRFEAKLLSKFDQPDADIGLLDGVSGGSAVHFVTDKESHDFNKIKWTGTIEGGKFSGRFEGVVKSGTFMMQKIRRLNPMLGAVPPAGAVVLFDGSGFDQWRPGQLGGSIDISDVLGRQGTAATAYLRCKIYSMRSQDLLLKLGSKEGVKVWLNGEVVHSNNVLRLLEPDQDEVKVKLKQGWNKLMIKVTTKGGWWSACVRFFTPDGKKPYDVWEKDIYAEEQNPTRVYLDMNGGYITTWYVSGPYKMKGKNAKELFDIEFEPEKDSENAEWQIIGREFFEKKTIKWKLIDGAMEVAPDTGSIVSKKEFRDFQLHMEFKTPFMPEARGQKRGNSGVYLQGRYEVQILDSYGLEGKDNECGGVYKISAPSVNMCAPPGEWQSYDILFYAPRFGDDGDKLADARLTVMHNGIIIQNNVEVPGPTGFGLDNYVTRPGGIYLQDHHNKVQFRNIWAVELPGED